MNRVPPPLHPRNRHRGHYDFAALVSQTPSLAAHVQRARNGQPSIDFANPAAVLALNSALLRSQYGIREWRIPEGYLCPPVPGRADYIHHLADLLAEDNDGAIPTGPAVRVLDIGVGANCIYPLLGTVEYGWQFVGSDIDAMAIQAAQATLDANPQLSQAVTLRQQLQRDSLFEGLLQAQECFDLTLCNPPFHASAAEASRGSQRKWRQLGKPVQQRAAAPLRNFGGRATELWCKGGEVSFLSRMIEESALHAECIYWFSSLVARAEHLPRLRKQLQKAGVRGLRQVAMAQGSKQSRFIAWTFLDHQQRQAWRAQRWASQPSTASDSSLQERAMPATR